MKIYSYKDPEVKKFLGKTAEYIKQAEALQMPYWIFVQDSNPVGMVVIGKEPIQLLAPPGTPMAMIQLIDKTQPREIIKLFAREASKFATQQKIGYALATFTFKEEGIDVFKEIGFQEFDDSYRMVCQLDREFAPPSELQFRSVRREEMRQFIEAAQRILQETPDITLTRALEHILDLSDEFLTMYYNREKFYFAEKDEEIVGILNLNPSKGLISNIGVESHHRGKGYGRQIMLFGLQKLKKSGCNRVYLRVHIENAPAIHLYESLGFVKGERYKTLLWEK